MRNIILATLLASIGLAAPALSGEVKSPANSNFYIGVQSGAANGTVLDTESLLSGVKDGYLFGGSETGVIGGIYAGLNMPTSSNFVLGVEGDVDFSNLDHRGFGENSGVVNTAYIEEWKSGFQGSLRARAGINAGNVLFYATGGLAVGQNTFDLYGTNLTASPDGFDKTMVGWTAGGGVEFAVSEGWNARVEYRYTNFGHVTVRPTVLGYNGAYDEKFDVVQHSVMVGLSHSF